MKTDKAPIQIVQEIFDEADQWSDSQIEGSGLSREELLCKIFCDELMKQESSLFRIRMLQCFVNSVNTV